MYTEKDRVETEIHNLREKLQLLELRLAKLPEGYMKRTRLFVERKLKGLPNIKWSFSVIDSFEGRTCGVLFRFYNGTDNGHTIKRSPRVEWLKSYVFNDSTYTVVNSYATPSGLVLEVRENN